jgi:glycosyltransferase involved in cell wall biosynthesis
MSGLPREAPATNHDALAPDHEATVSVIIPTYNRSGLLPRALDSVLTQTYKDLEVLVVDDASTDDTSEVVAAYESDPRVRYLPQKDNRGVSAARNRGLAEARGQFIAFLDSDDEWLPPKLERQMRRFRKLSDRVGLIYVGGTMVYEESTEPAQRPAHRGDVYDQLLVENFIYPTSGVIIRRDVVDEVGFFDEQIPANEDWDYWLRVARQFEIDSLAGQLVRYFAGHRRDRKSLVAQDDLDARARLYQKHLIEMRRTRSAFPFLMESARRHLVPSSWNPAAARHLLWKAIPHRPWAPEVYMKFVRSLLPRSVYMLLREKWRGLRRFSVRRARSSV